MANYANLKTSTDNEDTLWKGDGHEMGSLPRSLARGLE